MNQNFEIKSAAYISKSILLSLVSPQKTTFFNSAIEISFQVA